MNAPSAPIRVLVHGASGRMGRAVLALAPQFPTAQVVALTPSPQASGNTPSTALATLEQAPAFDVAIDFSVPAAVAPLLELCVKRNAALVCGTTGLDAALQRALENASARIPLLTASNFSLGVVALELLAAQAAAMLRDWDCEILDLHHRDKRDAPSGTALSLADAVATGRGHPQSWSDRIAAAAQGAKREPGSIGVAALRAGSVIGEHRVGFYGEGERIELSHLAENRDIFARGAWQAALRLSGRPAGRYTLRELLVG